MIVIDYIKKMKSTISSEVNTFGEILEKSTGIQELGEIVNYFKTINIKENGNLIHLKYNNKEMFNRPWDVFYESVRGLVIDWVNNEILLYPFDKFYELNEHKTTKLNTVRNIWEEVGKAEITEKIDGSLMISRYVRESYLTASSGSLNGIHVDLFNGILNNDEELKRFLKDYSNYTVMFEMTSKDLPQHIKYGIDSATIIGMRNMESFELLTLDEIRQLAKKYKVKVVKSFNLSINYLLETIEDSNSTIEGYIVRIGSLMVKFKTKNFIMANRFKSEPNRNFNVLIDSILEDRYDAISNLVSNEYKDSYDIGIDLFFEYANKRENLIKAMVSELNLELDNNEFAKEAQIKFPNNVKELMAFKLKTNKKFTKEDIKYLKKFSNFFSCVNHIKYAELNNLSEEDVLNDIEKGKIKFLHEYINNFDNKKVYIIHKWQWINKEEILSNIK